MSWLKQAIRIWLNIPPNPCIVVCEFCGDEQESGIPLMIHLNRYHKPKTVLEAR